MMTWQACELMRDGMSHAGYEDEDALAVCRAMFISQVHTTSYGLLPTPSADCPIAVHLAICAHLSGAERADAGVACLRSNGERRPLRG